MRHLLLCGLLLSAASHAQVQKCTIEGKTVYSDSQCGQHGTAINTTANTVDGSGLREQAQRNRDEAQRQQESAELDGQRASLAANVPLECKFKSFKNRDEKGRLLGQRAQAECIQNILNARQGKPPNLAAYGLWKDHNDRVSADRNAEAARSSAAINSRTPSRSMTCTANRYSAIPSMTCD